MVRPRFDCREPNICRRCSQIKNPQLITEIVLYSMGWSLTDAVGGVLGARSRCAPAPNDRFRPNPRAFSFFRRSCDYYIVASALRYIL